MRTARLAPGVVAFVVSACVTTPMPAAAQSAAVVLKGGIAFSGLQIGPPGATRGTDAQSGFVGGLAVTMPANRKFALQTELLINERRAVPATSDAPSDTVAYVVLPVFLRVRVAESDRTRIGLLMGPEFATNMTQRGGLIEERNQDYNIAIGVAIEVRRRVVVDVRYLRSLVSLAPGASANESVKTRGLTTMVGWRLH